MDRDVEGTGQTVSHQSCSWPPFPKLHLRIRMISPIWRPGRNDQGLSANLALPETRRLTDTDVRKLRRCTNW